MIKEQVRKEIEALMHDYAELQNKAMNDGDEILVAQNAGAYLALEVLLGNLGLDDELEKINNEEL